MTKGERRKKRKAVRMVGESLTGEREPHGHSTQEFTESPAGLRARERWARQYDALNGAPEGEGDR